MLGVAAVTPSALGFLDDRFWMAELAASVRVHLVLVALAVAVLAIVGRSIIGVGLATLALIVNALVLVPLYTSEPAAAAGADRLSIAHVNMRHHYGEFDDVRRSLDDRKPDVLVILDPSRGWLKKVSPRPIGYRVYIRPGLPQPRVLVLATRKVTNVDFPAEPELPTASVAFDVELDGVPVRVLAVHTVAPSTPRARSARDEELAAVGVWARRHAGPEVVLGDLNATPWSGVLQDLEDSGDLRNSAYGFGVQPTWPAFAGPLGIPIDQLLHSWDLTVTDRETGPGYGSAHRSLWVTIARSASRQAPG